MKTTTQSAAGGSGWREHCTAALAGILVTCGVLSMGCTKADDAGKPAVVPPSGPAMAPTATAPAAPPPPPAAPPPGPPAEAPPPAAADAPVPSDSGARGGGTIAGQIILPARMAKELAKQGPDARASSTMYLVARRLSDNPSARGTLIAVKKLPATSFPLAFTMGAADMPFQNGPFDGELSLTARIDQDGDPMTHQKGDIFGTIPKVKVGSRNVKLILDQLQQESESLGQPGAPMGPMGGPTGPMNGAGDGNPHQLPPGHPAL